MKTTFNYYLHDSRTTFSIFKLWASLPCRRDVKSRQGEEHLRLEVEQVIIKQKTKHELVNFKFSINNIYFLQPGGAFFRKDKGRNSQSGRADDLYLQKSLPGNLSLPFYST